jgi:flagellar basal body-associated protein FliL
VSRSRALVVVVLIVVFVIAGGALIYANSNKGSAKNITFDLSVTGANKMTVSGGTDPEKLAAHQNDTITINVTSDTQGEVHLHEYDIAFNVSPGQTTTHTFKADKTCTCEIEWEETSTHLGTLTVSP